MFSGMENISALVPRQLDPSEPEWRERKIMCEIARYTGLLYQHLAGSCLWAGYLVLWVLLVGRGVISRY